MIITTKYDIKDIVYLIHDGDQLPRMITEIGIISPKMHQYLLKSGCDESWHYDYEISPEVDNVIKTNN